MPEALNRKLLSLFQYFGISDGVDISRVSWRNGRYDLTELTKLYTGEKQRETGKKILLFVREQNRNDYRLAMSYVLLGEASFVKSYGARPMSIEWRLAEPIPAGLPKESRKLVG